MPNPEGFKPISRFFTKVWNINADLEAPEGTETIPLTAPTPAKAYLSPYSKGLGEKFAKDPEVRVLDSLGAADRAIALRIGFGNNADLRRLKTGQDVYLAARLAEARLRRGSFGLVDKINDGVWDL